jgi:PAS domain S-box-containing protein
MIGRSPILTKVKGIVYWQEKLFTNTITYSLPLSLIAIIPSVLTTYKQGAIIVTITDVTALLSISLVTLNPNIPIRFKKAYVAVTLYILAIILMITLGSFGMGSIYILALSVFLALLFPNRVAYASVAVNFLIYGALSFVIYFKLFDTPLINNYSFDYWIAYSLNFMFLNIAVVVQIRYLFNGLKTTLIQEETLLAALQCELDEKQQRNNILKESEGHYKSLFLLNPSPMWIYDVDTLQFLQVNKAAMKKYGYTEEEFLNMTIKEVRPKESLNELYEMLGNHVRKNGISENVTKHMNKSGEEFYVEVICSSIPFKGKEACLVISRDITKQIEHTQAIGKQNEKLKEIAHLQSHVVRAPLARIMGLVNLINQGQDKDTDKQLHDYLDISVQELDGVIRAIVGHSEDVIPLPQSAYKNKGK